MGTRVAVVVVAGVGDEATGASTVRIAEGLARYRRWTAGTEVLEWFPSPREGAREGDSGSLQSVRRITMRRAARQAAAPSAEVDIFEFWWADLSRFPAALRSFVAAFLGLFIDMPGVGRAALLGANSLGPGRAERNLGPKEGETHSAYRARWLAVRALSGLGWLIAVPIVIVTLIALALAGFLILAVYLESLDAPGLAVDVTLGVVGLIALVAAAKAVRRYRNSGRALIVTSAVVLLGAATVFGVEQAVRHDRPASLALEDTLVATVAYPFRLLWLAVFALAASVVVLLLARTALGWRGTTAREAWWRRSVTALLTTAIGPLGIALLFGALVAAVGVVAQPLLDRGELSRTDGPWCLADPQDWIPSSADCSAAGVGEGGQTPTLWAWGSALFGQALAPLVVAVLALVASLVLMLLWSLGQYVVAFARGRRGDAPGDRVSRRLNRMYAAVDRFLGPLLVVLILAGAWFGAAMWLSWLPIPEGARLGEAGTRRLSITVAILGVAVSAMLLLAKALGITPSGIATGGRANERVRSILDRVYDVATYLREPPKIPRWVPDLSDALARRTPSRLARLMSRVMPAMTRARMPRERMVARFGALLDHLHRHAQRGAPAPYDRLVILAHSQGTALTVTMLSDPPHHLPRDVRLITFGSPLRQLYAQRLPQQFEWVTKPDLRGYLSARSNLSEWVSLATPGDFVGRTVHRPVPVPWPNRIVSTRRRVPPTGPDDRPLALAEFTLPTGTHGTYWSDEVLYRQLVRMIDAPG